MAVGVPYPPQWAEPIGHIVGHFWGLDFSLFRASTYLRLVPWNDAENSKHTMGKLWRLTKAELAKRFPGDARVDQLDDALDRRLIPLRNALAHGAWHSMNADGSLIKNLRNPHVGLSLRMAEVEPTLAEIRDATALVDTLRAESIAMMKAAGVRFPEDYATVQGAPSNEP